MPQLTEIMQIPVRAGAKNTHKDCLFSSVPKASRIAPNICRRETKVGRTFAIAISVTFEIEREKITINYSPVSNKSFFNKKLLK